MLLVTPVQRQRLNDELLYYLHNILLTEEPCLINTQYLGDKAYFSIKSSNCQYRQCIIKLPTDKGEYASYFIELVLWHLPAVLPLKET
jgi:hypothetical protein